jgi:hypothetical protein
MQARTASLIKGNASLIILAVATLSLVVFPVPVCFDCEPSYSWGQTDQVALRNAVIYLAWLLAAPFIAGLFRFRRAWLIPICLTASHIATQHLGGVPWWDVKANEGPMIFIVELPEGLVSLIAGTLLKTLWDWYRENRTKHALASLE